MTDPRIETAPAAGTSLGYALFDTALGTCAIAWSAAGVAGVQLPDRDPDRTRDGLLRHHEGAVQAEPPAAISDIIAGIQALLDGQHVSFDGIDLDPVGVPEFNQRVYELTRRIPVGSTLSYGEIASRLGSPGAARAVGRALGDNPYPIVVPCHRVLAADGSMHGFSAPGGIATKRRMLRIEGALPPEEPTLF
ncbi:MAG: methylated-DNA--[protein]-cysteine S-methyltransferase [Jatrophihabitantaceae bacterium]